VRQGSFIAVWQVVVQPPNHVVHIGIASRRLVRLVLPGPALYLPCDVTPRLSVVA
jgi:hypothetical protein